MKFKCSSFMFMVITLGFLHSMVQAETHYYDFVLSEKNFTRMCSTKSMLVVNESFPGPVIRVQKGDTVFVNVYNQGIYDVTLHWHGVKQPRNPWYDGPEFITQCGIEPGSNFTYEVIFSDEEGTLWWHAHSRWMRESIHGAIVISPLDGTSTPYPEPDGDEVLVLSAWYEDDLMELVGEDLANGTDLPNSDAYLINGQPGDYDTCAQNSTYSILVDYGKTYLLRLVNAVMNEEMYFAIADHNLTVVSMDGAYTSPLTSTFVLISPGQTMNILVTADHPAGGEYYIAARALSTDDPPVNYLDSFNATAIFRYSNSPPSSPIFPATLPMNMDMVSSISFTNQIRSLANDYYPINVPTNVTTRMFVTVSMNDAICSSCSAIVAGTKLSASLNNISWLNPSIDILSAYYSNISGYYTADFPTWPETFFNFTSDDLPDNTTTAMEATKVKMLEYNEGVEIVFQGTNVLKGSMNHPMHLHGYSFYVVGSGAGNFDNETDPNTYNLVNPPAVNTFSVPKNGWLAIRFFADNPGVWLWHCHFDKHLSWGMDTVLIVKNGDTPDTSLRQRPANMPSCSSDLVQKNYNANDSKMMQL